LCRLDLKVVLGNRRAVVEQDPLLVGLLQYGPGQARPQERKLDVRAKQGRVVSAWVRAPQEGR
jgi:hypothetical protein